MIDGCSTGVRMLIYRRARESKFGGDEDLRSRPTRTKERVMYIYLPMSATKTKSVELLNNEQPHQTIPFFFVIDTIISL